MESPFGQRARRSFYFYELSDYRGLKVHNYKVFIEFTLCTLWLMNNSR